MIGYEYLRLTEARNHRKDKFTKEIYTDEKNFVASRYLKWMQLLTLIRKNTTKKTT